MKFIFLILFMLVSQGKTKDKKTTDTETKKQIEADKNFKKLLESPTIQTIGLKLSMYGNLLNKTEEFMWNCEYCLNCETVPIPKTAWTKCNARLMHIPKAELFHRLFTPIHILIASTYVSQFIVVSKQNVAVTSRNFVRYAGYPPANIESVSEELKDVTQTSWKDLEVHLENNPNFPDDSRYDPELKKTVAEEEGDSYDYLEWSQISYTFNGKPPKALNDWHVTEYTKLGIIHPDENNIGENIFDISYLAVAELEGRVCITNMLADEFKSSDKESQAKAVKKCREKLSSKWNYLMTHARLSMCGLKPEPREFDGWKNNDKDEL